VSLDSKNYYDVLEITPNATGEEIHRSYQRSKNAYSGDSIALYSLMTKDECDQMLELIEEAYSVLSIPEKRREYDKVRGINKVMTNNSTEAHSIKAINPTKGNDFSYDEKNLHQHQRDSFQSDNNYLKFGDQHTRTDVNVSKVSAFNKYSLDYEVNHDFEQQIENASEFTGAFLKQIREYKNVSIERLAEMTKISKTYIRHIEDDNWEKLPAHVYTRGFIFQYAKCLKLNSELIATSYLHHLKRLKDGAQ
jgi:curved DNA-binding protein CbpA